MAADTQEPEETPTRSGYVWVYVEDEWPHYAAWVDGLEVQVSERNRPAPVGYGAQYSILAQVDGVPVSSVGHAMATLEEAKASGIRSAKILAAAGWTVRS